MRKPPDSTATTAAIGAAGEDAAQAYLLAHGLKAMARNVRYRFGEIDLIARDGNTLVFVEVRQRRDNAFGGAAASVDRRKCARIARAASAWLAAQPALAQLPCRFDVIALSGERDSARIDWIRNAFTLDDVRG